jgi:hypothetical protein
MFRQRAGGPARTRDELASAVGTRPAEFLVGARDAERALEGADPRVRGIGGKIAIAALAAGAKLQHMRRIAPFEDYDDPVTQTPATGSAFFPSKNAAGRYSSPRFT